MRWLLLILFTVGCAKQPAISTVREARYNTELTVVYREARAAVAEKRKIVDEDPDAGTFKTAAEDIELSFSAKQKQSFRAHFEIAVTGDRPWRISVAAIVDSGEPDATALAQHTDRIERVIYDRLRPFASP